MHSWERPPMKTNSGRLTWVGGLAALAALVAGCTGSPALHRPVDSQSISRTASQASTSRPATGQPQAPRTSSRLRWAVPERLSPRQLELVVLGGVAGCD